MAPARSTWLGSLITGSLVAIGVGYTALRTGMLLIALIMGLVGLAVAITIASRRTPGPVAQAVAAVLVPGAAIMETAGFGLILQRGLQAGAFSGDGLGAVLSALITIAVPLGVGLAAMVGALGVIATLRTNVDTDGTVQVIGIGLFTMLLLGVLLGASLTRRVILGEAVVSEWVALVTDAGSIVASVIGPTDPRAGLLIFFLLLAAAGVSGFQAIRTVPVTELAPSHSRDRIDRTTSALQRLFGWSGVVGAFGAVIVVMMADVGALNQLLAADFGFRAVARFLGSGGLHGLLIIITTVFGAVTLSIALLQRATGGIGPLLRRVIPASVGALGVMLVAVTVGPQMTSTLENAIEPTSDSLAQLLQLASPAEIVLLGAAIAVGLLVATLIGLVVVGVVGLVPNRSLGAVFAGSGLGTVGIVLALHGASPLAVFGALGLAIVSWDASDRSVRAVAELDGGKSPSMAVELLHWGASGGVAAVGILAAMGLMLVVLEARVGADTEFTLAALAAVTGGFAVLIGLIRG